MLKRIFCCFILSIVVATIFVDTATYAAVPINTVKGWSDSPAISRDGKRLYFMYSRYNFGSFIKSGFKESPTSPTGPDRIGLKKHDNAWGESDTYMAVKNPDGTWKEAVALGFNGAYGDACGMEFNDGNSFVWLQGNEKGNDIVISHKGSDGKWSKPVSVGPKINLKGSTTDNPYISPDGNLLWFTSDRSGGMGGKDIWFSQNIDGTWSDPINLGAPYNTDGDEDQIWISPVGLDVYWNGPKGMMHCVSDGATCKEAEVVSIPGCPIAAEASVTDDGNLMYFACADTKDYNVKIMYSQKQTNGTWGRATPVD